MSVAYVKFFPSDWKAGCIGLSLIEEIIYFKICLHNWDTGEALAEKNLTRIMLGHDVSITDALQYLIDEGKVKKTSKGFVNKRSLEIHDDANSRREKAVNAANKRWKNNDKLNDASALLAHTPSICQPEPEPEPEPYNKQTGDSASDLFPQKEKPKYSPEFESVWKALPVRKSGVGSKERASKHFRKATNEISPENILLKAEAYAVSRKSENPEYHKTKENWLRDAGDKPEAAPSPKKRRLV